MSYQADVTDVTYQYDGSFAGFLCCIFESYRKKELPAAVTGPEEEQLTLFAVRRIPTDPTQARRVYRGLGRLGQEVKARVAVGFLNTDPGKELTLLRFARLCFDQGPAAARMLGHPDCAAAFALERAVRNDAHLCKEFLRFEERGGMLGAVLHPRHCVLPLLRGHFCDRLPDEDFLIYDASHGAAMLRQNGRVQYLRMERYDPLPDDAEPDWQQLWKSFFRAVTIEPRRNERCQQTHCYKRYWGDMPEMVDQMERTQRRQGEDGAAAAKKVLPEPGKTQKNALVRPKEIGEQGLTFQRSGGIILSVAED